MFGESFRIYKKYDNFVSMKTLKHQATIEYGYWLLRKKQAEISEIENEKNPLNRAIDQSCNRVGMMYMELIPIIEEIINSKKCLNMDTGIENELIRRINLVYGKRPD